MRKLTDQFKLMLASEALSLCYLFELTLKDASVYRYTDSSETIKYNGTLWRADPGIQLSAVRDTQDSFNQTATIEIGYASDMLTEVLVRKNGLDGATFSIVVIDYRDKSLGVLDLFSGHVDRLTASNKFSCSIDLTGWQGKSVSTTGVYSLKCRNVFGDKNCGINLDNYSYPFTVGGDSSDGVTFIYDGNAPEGVAAYGSVLWTGGPNAGEVSLVAYNAGDQVALTVQPPTYPQAGNTGILRAGCDFYAETCLTRFNNLINLEAEPTVPQGTETSAGKSETTSVADPYKPQPVADENSSRSNFLMMG